MKVRTNYQWRQFKYRYEVPSSVLDWYDWLDDDESYDGWIKYLDRWYHVTDFMRLDGPHPEKFGDWHGVYSDSFFSGVVIRLSDDGEEYQIGTYLS